MLSDKLKSVSPPTSNDIRVKIWLLPAECRREEREKERMVRFAYVRTYEDSERTVRMLSLGRIWSSWSIIWWPSEKCRVWCLDHLSIRIQSSEYPDTIIWVSGYNHLRAFFPKRTDARKKSISQGLGHVRIPDHYGILRNRAVHRMERKGPPTPCNWWLGPNRSSTQLANSSALPDCAVESFWPHPVVPTFLADHYQWLFQPSSPQIERDKNG